MQNIFLFNHRHHFRLIILFAFVQLGRPAALAQFPDSIGTGYLLDQAEEYWPLVKDSSARSNWLSRLKHVPIHNSKGYVGIGLNLRETYENFNGYLWGIGPQDKNGYFLHRVLAHADVRWNRHFRMFTEIQSSTISNRNGGPRPVQDLNELAVNQFFGEVSVLNAPDIQLRFRLGKQALHYGIGSLLDIREANVRRTFAGGKAILEKRNLRVDAFYMRLIKAQESFFDDDLDKNQSIGGVWITLQSPHKNIDKLDYNFLVIKRDQTRFNQGIGSELRYTTGTALHLKSKNWSGYSEADIQWGKFNSKVIFAWKAAQSVIYQFPGLKGKPVLSVQGALSSGDMNQEKHSLQSFNPIYPKAIYYGFIDNVGSANIILLHPKAVIQLHAFLKLTGGYYQFWRQSINDGIYAANGAFLFPSANNQRRVGEMFDVAINFNPTTRFAVQIIGAYYKRGSFLQQQVITSSNIRYVGLRTSLRL